ncbi:hypothetical protein ACH4VQ_39385 [Streptomyces anulatus]
MYKEQDRVTDYLDQKELDIAYRRITASGALPSMMPAFALATVVLAPFITSLMSALGDGLGKRIEDATVLILRRVPRPAILRRSPRIVDAQVEAGDVNRVVDFIRSALSVTVDGGTRIQLSNYTPVEALALLPTIDFTDVHGLGDVPTTVRWISDQWHAVSIKDGQVAVAAWDPEIQQWSTVLS